MFEFRWINMFLFVVMGIQFTEVATGKYSSLSVTPGGNATLYCANLIDDQKKCNATTWLFSGSSARKLVTLTEHGRIKEEASSKSNRLRVKKDCSLHIKKVRVEDGGLYTCRQFDKFGQQQGEDAQVNLSVTKVATGKYSTSLSVTPGDNATLYCPNVIDDEENCNAMTWLFNGSSARKLVTLTEHGRIKEEASSKSNRLRVKKDCSLHIKKVRVEDGGLYTCRQFDKFGQQQGEDAQVNLSVTTKTRMTTTTATIRTSARTTGKDTPAATPTTANDNASTKLEALLWFLILILAAVIITAVVVTIYKKRQGNKTQMNKNTGVSLNPAEPQSAPETSQDTTDPEDGVSYASVSFTKKTNSKVQFQRKDEGDDEDEAVTYSTVKTSFSARASTDPSSLYAAINKRQK